MSKRKGKMKMTRFKQNGKVVRAVSHLDWVAKNYVRLDLDLAGGGKPEAHLYIPANHPLAGLVKGTSVKIVVGE